MRIVIALVIVGAVVFMAGLLLVVVGVALQTVGKHPDTQTIGLGAEVAVAGFSFGMIVLAILVLLRGGITGAGITSAPGRGRAGQYRPAMAAAGAGGRNGAGANGQADGDGRAYAGAGARTGAGFMPNGHPGRAGPQPASNGGRNQRGRDQALNPSNVITPGGLLDMPGSTPRGFAQDRATAGQPAGPDGYWPGAGNAPGGARPSPAGSRAAQAGPRAGQAGPPTAPGGQRPAQPGTPSAQGGKRPAPGAPPPVQAGQAGPLPGQRPGQAGPAGQYASQAGHQGRVPGDAGRRQAGAAAHAASGPAGAAGPAVAGHAGGAWPQGHPTAPAPGGPRPAYADGTASDGPGTTPEPPLTGFDVFAKAKPSQPAPEMYVYRDTGEPDEPERAAKPENDEQDAAYWYGLAEPEPPAPEPEARGPFEPLVISSAASAEQPAAEPEEHEDPADQHERKLEQIKDFYLTAEAIGEENVDKHFDVLLAQQRELISEYFKQSGLRRPAESEQDGTAQAEAAPT